MLHIQDSLPVWNYNDRPSGACHSMNISICTGNLTVRQLRFFKVGKTQTSI